MEKRDNKGRFIKGHIEDVLTREKRIKSLQISAKKNKSYLGELKYHPLYNIWRSFKFTQKGQKIGNSKEWDDFKTFYKDILPHFEKGKRFNRKDISKPYSNDNFIFLTDDEVGLRLKTEKIITYKGQTKPLEEWIIELDLNESGVRQRYYQGIKNNHSSDRILFGIKSGKAKKIVDYKKLEYQKIRDKASKMIASYNNKDKKKGLNKSDLNIDWFIENIFMKECIYCGDKERLGADRIDNTKNHDKCNVIPCCYECNIARGDNFTVEEMLIVGKAINEVKTKRKNNG